MAEITTFRPTPEVQEILSRVKEEGTNVSKFINNVILSAASGEKTHYVTQFILYPGFPDNEEYPEDYGGMILAQAVSLLSVPISFLSVRRYKEFKDVLKAFGLDQYYFKIDPDNSFCLISTSKEEASVEFGKYFMRDPETKEYVRTMLPLPQIRYDFKNRTVIIVRKEPQL